MSRNTNWKETNGKNETDSKRTNFNTPLCYSFSSQYHCNSNEQTHKCSNGHGNFTQSFFPSPSPLLEKKWVLYNHWMQKGWHLIVQSIQINNMLCASISCYIPRILNSKLLHRTVFFLFLSLSFDWLIGLFFFRSLFLSMIRKSILHCV